MKLEKHTLNILPEMSEEEKNELRESLKKNGFDKNFPIFIFEGKVLDGWNRYELCLELEIEPVFKYLDDEFSGSPEKAIDFIRQVNTRRNLNASQRAALAVECEDLITRLREETENQRRDKQSRTRKENKEQPAAAEAAADADASVSADAGESAKNESDDRADGEDEDEDRNDEIKNPGDDDAGQDGDRDDEHENKTATKLAQKFGTNRTYVADAARLKKESPEEFEKVKSGEKSISQAKKDSLPKQRTYFEEISARFAEYVKALRKFQTFAQTEMVLNLHALYANILDSDLDALEKLNAEIATFVLCEDCGGAGCVECEARGYFKPVEATEAAEAAA